MAYLCYNVITRNTHFEQIAQEAFMREIGGYFPYIEEPDNKNHYLDGLCPPEGDLRFLMSGRCANYLALEDFKKQQPHPVAYVPLYTCETVIDPFVKAGYELIFYDFTKDMIPVFDESVLDKIHLISICGYYGFSGYDREFLKKCEERGICIIEDTTHSIFSADGIYEGCTYVVGRMRKWLGVSCGGFAIKKTGSFTPLILPPHEVHLNMRRQGLAVKTDAFRHPDTVAASVSEDASRLLWDAELLLRKVYDIHGSDSESVDIIEYYDFDALKRQRRENYRYMLEHCTKSDAYTIVFPYLDDATVPSHFTLYAADRGKFKEYLSQNGIHATSYWPVGPYINLEGHTDCAYIYDHVISIPCDQRYTAEDMAYICRVLKDF